jgi:hypothetical protein
MQQDFITVLKRMKNERFYTSMVNKTDNVSFSRSNGYYSVTVIYDIKSPSKKKVCSWDSRDWNEIANWLRERFDYRWRRKIEPAEIKFTI